MHEFRSAERIQLDVSVILLQAMLETLCSQAVEKDDQSRKSRLDVQPRDYSIVPR